MWRWSLITAGLIALFWAIWYLAAGSVPVVTSIKMTGNWTLELPFGVSRWWGILIGPIWSIALISLSTSEIIKKDEDLVIGLIVGLAVGLLFGLVVGLDADLVVGLGFGLVLGLAVGLVVGLFSGLDNSLGLGLGFSLFFGLAVGLLFGLVVGLGCGLGVGLGVVLKWIFLRISGRQPGIG